MVITATLTSLAILRVQIDRGGDYLDYLSPFILQVLFDNDMEIITNVQVCQHLRNQCGLEIPERTVEIVLRRIAQNHPIKKDNYVYRKTAELVDPQVTARRIETERHIDSLVKGLRDFSQQTVNPINDNQRAIIAICAFLAKFDITCLRAYLRGTVIPDLDEFHPEDIVLVGKYIKEIERSSPERFSSFIILVQGHMLANALLCPDLEHIKNTYTGVHFYFDTPFLLNALGLEGEAGASASRDLLRLLRHLGGKTLAFSHSCEELKNVLRGIANNFDSPSSHGQIAQEVRMQRSTRSDIFILSELIEEKLIEIDIIVERTPRYEEALQIDEQVLEKVIDANYSYQNPRAKERDINSVRSIYVLRGGKPALSLEKSRAIFVTTNSAFAKAAWTYGQQHESSHDVSTVITDFSLANIAWLKAPMGAPSLPTTQILASAYAALQPSPELLKKYMNEIDKLEKNGTISTRDHQILRSSLAHDELMYLTLGQDAALNEETLMQTLERVTLEIKREETEKLSNEQAAHQITKEKLDISHQETEDLIANVYWNSYRKSISQSNLLFYVVGCVLMFDLIFSLLWTFIISFTGAFFLVPIPLFAGALGLISRWRGISVVEMRSRLQKWLLVRDLKRQAKVLNVDFSNFLS